MKALTYLELAQLEGMKEENASDILRISHHYLLPVEIKSLVSMFQLTDEFKNGELKQKNRFKYIQFKTDSKFVVEFRLINDWIYDCLGCVDHRTFELWRDPKNIDQLISDLQRFNFNLLFNLIFYKKLII
jgi:hypothetical protein